jgi:AcrR family transcriptional regulator
MIGNMATSKKITRKEREKERYKTEILLAAESVFSEKGYERARMSDIALKAEFSVGYLYQTWESKEDLYVSLFESKITEHIEYVQKRVKATADPLEQIDLLIESTVDFIDANKPFAKLVLAESSPMHEHVLEGICGRAKKIHDGHHQFIEKIFAAGVRDGTFVDMAPYDLALALDGIINAFAKDHIKNAPNKSFVPRGDVIKQVFFNSILKKKTRKESRKS